MATWTIDQEHSIIGFKVKHLMVSTVRGAFAEFAGSVETADDTFENAKAVLTVQTNSVDTRSAGRDAHLRSGDFFEVEKFPTMNFISTSFMKKGESYEVVGDLTLHGVTKSVTLAATSGGIGVGFDGKRVAGFDVAGTIKRSDFGLVWNTVLEAGTIVVGDDVLLDMHIEAKEA